MRKENEHKYGRAEADRMIRYIEQDGGIAATFSTVQEALDDVNHTLSLEGIHLRDYYEAQRDVYVEHLNKRS